MSEKYTTSIKLDRGVKDVFDVIARMEGYTGWGEKVRDMMEAEVKGKRKRIANLIESDDGDDLI